MSVLNAPRRLTRTGRETKALVNIDGNQDSHHLTPTQYLENVASFDTF